MVARIAIESRKNDLLESTHISKYIRQGKETWY